MGNKSSSPAASTAQSLHTSMYNADDRAAHLTKGKSSLQATRMAENSKVLAENKAIMEDSGDCPPPLLSALNSPQISPSMATDYALPAPSFPTLLDNSEEMISAPQTTRQINPDGTITITTTTLLGCSSITVPNPAQKMAKNRKNYNYSEKTVISWIINGNFSAIKLFIHYNNNDDVNLPCLFDNSLTLLHLITILNINMLYEFLNEFWVELDLDAPTSKPLLGRDDSARAQGKYLYCDQAEFLYQNHWPQHQIGPNLLQRSRRAQQLAQQTKGHYLYYDHCTIGPENRYRDIGLTAIMLAVIFCADCAVIDTVSALISAGATANLTTQRCGYTALMFSVKRANPSLLSLLLDADPQLNFTNLWGFSALDIARENDFHEKCLAQCIEIQIAKLNRVKQTLSSWKEPDLGQFGAQIGLFDPNLNGIWVPPVLVNIILEYSGWKHIAKQVNQWHEEQIALENQYSKDNQQLLQPNIEELDFS
jgi:hypothetical protein